MRQNNSTAVNNSDISLIFFSQLSLINLKVHIYIYIYNDQYSSAIFN